ncbi:MAG: hypothetical protein WBB24_12620 [Maribacter sp.]
MKSKFILFLALLLTLAIFTPSVRSFLNLDAEKSLVVDINEEEHQNEDELEQQQYVLVQNSFLFPQIANTHLRINSVALFKKNGTPLDILSPPPRYTF